MDKRQALIDAAADLAHEQGFGATTLAMVSERSGVPLGNVYYYFRTKEALADAVLDRRLCEVQEAIDSLKSAGGPREQLLAFLAHSRETSEMVARNGCQLGKISQDVCSGDDCSRELPVAKMGQWCETQMKGLGLSGAKARDAALHFMSAIQGASLLTWVSHDPKLLRRETRTLETWIATL